MNKKISIEEMTQEMKEKYTLTLEEAHKMLLEHEVTKSKNVQVTMRWIRDGKIDGVLIGKGRVETRKWLVSEESLLEFIDFERLTLGDYKAMKKELQELRGFKFEVENKPTRTRKKTTPKDKTEDKK
ncbi:hypothetical protein [Bacillus cereus]|uniref:hypothetical protein n=1 Tax=Bacillus cereus TaxID=1396 RepID=UPI001962719F|nr:hypothetical protein [Bacillus cereus]BCD09077.1 hypothetical protein BC30052_p63 [Bacillus cereus]HDR4563496.1 hypothetical protein [Bacillus luti]